MKILKKVLILIVILLIQSVTFVYKSISKFWTKNKENIKSFVKRLEKELKVEL